MERPFLAYVGAGWLNFKIGHENVINTETIISVGKWAIVDNKLISTSDRRAANVPASRCLDQYAVIRKILEDEQYSWVGIDVSRDEGA